MRSQLRTLSKTAADGVARHLVAAGRLVDEDPQAALQHARAARALGSRVAVVREAVGETAYAAGEWAEAIAELRTARRMTGDDSALPMIADSERALGRPDRALRIAQSDEVQALAPADRAEMRIVEAGARRDLGQLDAALVTLQDAGLDRRSVEPWSVRIWYAYADLLLEAGREDEAREWFVAAAEADVDGTTDADERLLILDGIEILDEDEDDAEFDGGATSDQDATPAEPSDEVDLDDEADSGEASGPADDVDDKAELGDGSGPADDVDDEAELDDEAEPDDVVERKVVAGLNVGSGDAVAELDGSAELDDDVEPDGEAGRQGAAGLSVGPGDASAELDGSAEPDDDVESDDQPDDDVESDDQPDDDVESDDVVKRDGAAGLSGGARLGDAAEPNGESELGEVGSGGDAEQDGDAKSGESVTKDEPGEVGQVEVAPVATAAADGAGLGEVGGSGDDADSADEDAPGAAMTERGDDVTAETESNDVAGGTEPVAAESGESNAGESDAGESDGEDESGAGESDGAGSPITLTFSDRSGE